MRVSLVHSILRSTVAPLGISAKQMLACWVVGYPIGVMLVLLIATIICDWDLALTFIYGILPVAGKAYGAMTAIMWVAGALLDPAHARSDVGSTPCS